MTINQVISLALEHHQAGRIDQAERLYRAVLETDAGNFNALHLLGAIAIQRWECDAAVELLQRATGVNPNVAEVHCNLGMALQLQGRVHEALAAYERAIAINPNFIVAHNNRIYALHFKPSIDDVALHRAQRAWNERFAQPLTPKLQPHVNARDPDKRLKIGYVSPNFCSQAESFFVVPLLAHHDRGQFEVHCYSSVMVEDAITSRHRKHVERWHDVRAFDDRNLAAQIRSDGIDILVDLTMHMAHSRLLTVAQRPAPIQVTYLAYPGGTGMDAMDYRLTDRYLDPPATPQSYSERSIQLPNCWCCYDPLMELPATVARPPDWQGPICFGSLNNPFKLNVPTIELWSRSLLAVPGSRLLLLTDSEHQRQDIRQQMAASGIDPVRVEFVNRCPREQYLRLYDRIDIALDPLPYNGITTTCDALWMGVPVVTLAGEIAAGRAGMSILSNAKLSDLVAKTPEEFIALATNLAADHARLSLLRATMRDRMKSSPVMDAARFTADLESAYRRMWRSWSLNC